MRKRERKICLDVSNQNNSTSIM